MLEPAHLRPAAQLARFLEHGRARRV